MPQGKVKWFSTEKAYGFIEQDNDNDIFVHVTGLAEGVTAIDKDMVVEYEVEQGRKGPQATKVRPVTASAPAAEAPAEAADDDAVDDDDVEVVEVVEVERSRSRLTARSSRSSRSKSRSSRWPRSSRSTRTSSPNKLPGSLRGPAAGAVLGARRPAPFSCPGLSVAALWVPAS